MVLLDYILVSKSLLRKICFYDEFRLIGEGHKVDKGRENNTLK